MPSPAPLWSCSGWTTAHQHRNKLNALSKDDAESARFLADGDSWTGPYFEPGTKEYAERWLFR